MDIREAITRVRTEVCEFIYDCTECISDGCPYYVLLNTAYNVVNSEQTEEYDFRDDQEYNDRWGTDCG